MVLKAEGVIPPEAFDASEPERKFGKSKGWPTYAAAPLLIRGACETLGISQYQLNNLLDMRGTGLNAYTNGKSRLSSLYVCRLAYLFLLRIQRRLQPSRVQKIDWATGHLTWKNGSEPKKLGPNQSVGRGPRNRQDYPTKAAA